MFRGRVEAGEGGLRELAALGLGVAAGLVAAGLGGGGGHAERDEEAVEHFGWVVLRVGKICVAVATFLQCAPS